MNMINLEDLRTAHAAIILAGGDGTRLRPLTRLIAGADVPKQFCALNGRNTLLAETQRRVALSISPVNTVVVTNQEHRRHYRTALNYLPDDNLIEQTGNRGTAPAILHGLARLHRLIGDATVTIFPSDHFVDDNLTFMGHVEIAMRAVDRRPTLAVVLGIAPNYPEPSYGWIQPGEPMGDSLEEVLLQVKCFWEKPSAEFAEKLWLGGSFWNSFVITARVSYLLDLFKTHTPALYVNFSPVLGAHNSNDEITSAAQVYQHLEPVSFSDEIMTAVPRRLAIRPVNNVAWSDLGEPQRAYQAVKASGWRPPWLQRAREMKMPWALEPASRLASGLLVK